MSEKRPLCLLVDGIGVLNAKINGTYTDSTQGSAGSPSQRLRARCQWWETDEQDKYEGQ